MSMIDETPEDPHELRISVDPVEPSNENKFASESVGESMGGDE